MKNQTFKIGDRVVCLYTNDSFRKQPRTKGEQYDILDVHYCQKCGVQHVNIAGNTPKYFPNGSLVSDNMACYNCNAIYKSNGLWWTDSNAFVKLNEIEAAIEELLAEEKYEECAILRDINNK